MKIQTKTTILFTILTATIFLILNITVYFFIDNFSHTDFNKRLELRAKISAKFRFEQGEVSTESFREIQRQYLEKLPEEKAIILRRDSLSFTKADNVEGTAPVKYLKEIVTANGGTVWYQSRFRHFAGFLYKDETGDFLVIKSATNQIGSEMMRQLGWIKFFTLICAVALIYSVGLYFSKKTFKPFRDIINRANQISEGNLHLRLPEQEGKDEIGELTSTFNQMLSRLQTAFEAQNNFISNASHELRTPLTAIVGEADFALSKERSVEDYQQSLEQIIQQSEKLQRLTKGLLSLAQTGFDGTKQSYSSIRLDQLLFDVKDNCDAILPENNIRISLNNMPSDEALISIKGNNDQLRMAIGNIAMNACKYSNNNIVTLQLLVNEKYADIVVSDNGIGIPPDELKHIYDPFFRASNTQKFEGYGIGMPLSRNIIRSHKWEILVHSTVNVGTVVTVRLPIGA